MTVQVRVEGLAQLRKRLAAVEDIEGRAELRAGLKDAADLVAADAKGRVPKRSGRAAASIRPGVSGNRAYVAGGRKTVPYYGWLDFGSRSPISGRARSVGPWAKTGQGPGRGRFIYPAFDAKRAQVVGAVDDAMTDILRRESLL